MLIVGAIIFYIGFFGFLVGTIALLKGSIESLKIKDRKQALKVIGISIIVAIVGSLIVGPEGSRTSSINFILAELAQNTLYI